MTEVTLPARHADQGARLHAARIAAGLTESELASQLDSTTTSSVSNWERGHSQPLYWLRPKVATVLGVPYHRLFIPEEVADGLLIGPRRLLLTAHHLHRHADRWYVETGRGAERTNAQWLAKDWLVEDAGPGVRKSRIWQLTLPGEDVLDVLRADQ
jgi:transcriptional regulator with XRE-family HTH domain